MRRRCIVFALGVLLLGAGSVRSEDGEPGRPVRPKVQLPAAPRGVLNEGTVRQLTLRQAVQMGLEANLELRAGRIDPAIAGAAYQAERAIFDPLLAADFEFARRQTPQTSEFFGRPVTSDNTVSGSAGIQQLLPSGGTVSFLYRADRLNTDSLFVSRNPTWTQGLGVEGSQPLLRGAGDIVMANIRRAHNDVVASREGVRTLRQATILEIAVLYWELARRQEVLKARFKSEETAAELLRDAEARLEAKVGTPLNVAEARAGLERRRGLRFADEGNLAAQQDLLRTQIMPFTPADSAGLRFQARDDVLVATVQYPSRSELERYVAMAMTTRPVLRSLDARLASRNIDVTAAANGVLPQVDLVASVGSRGLDGAWGDSFKETITGQAVSAAVGMRFSMFIGQRAARSRLRLTQWARRQAVLRYKQQQNQVVAEVRNGARTVITAQAVLGTARAQVASAEENLRGEEQLLKQGKSTPFKVLQKEEELTDARLTLATAATEVRKAEAGFWWSIGLLGEKLGFGR